MSAASAAAAAHGASRTVVETTTTECAPHVAGAPYTTRIKQAKATLLDCAHRVVLAFAGHEAPSRTQPPDETAAIGPARAAHFVQQVLAHECTVALSDEEALAVVKDESFDPQHPRARMARGVWSAYRALSSLSPLESLLETAVGESAAAESDSCLRVLPGGDPGGNCVSRKAMHGEEAAAALFPGGFAGIGLGYATPDLLKELHSFVMREVDPHTAGHLRAGPAMPIGGTVPYASPRDIGAALVVACDELNERMHCVREGGGAHVHRVYEAALASAAFFQEVLYVHPFADGNGRTARVALCACMGQVEGLPFTLAYPSREAYLDALDTCRSTHVPKRRLGMLQLATMIVEGLCDALSIPHTGTPGNTLAT